MSTSTSNGKPGLIEDVLSSVIDQVTAAEDLKNIRLCSKLLAELAALRLFNSMTLGPFKDCLETFISFMEASPHIAKCVRELCYDAGDGYYTVKRRTKNRDRGVDLIRWATLDGIVLNGQDLEIGLLTQCLKLLPMLTHLRVVEIPPTPTPRSLRHSMHLEAYFRRLYSQENPTMWNFGSKSFPRLYLRTSSVVLACQSVRPKLHSLRIENVNAYTLRPSEPMRQILSASRSVFADLKEFDLGCGGDDESSTPRPLSLATQENVGQLIAATTSVERLHLKMTELYVPSSRSEIPSTYSWLSKLARDENGTLRNEPTHPYLKSLRLCRMIFHESELLTVVRNHRQTLRNLCLQDITLTTSPEDGDLPACWVRLLAQLRPYQIAITLDGKFTNLHHQWWKVTKHNSDLLPVTSSGLTDLQTQVQTWASGSGSEDTCPIKKAALRIGVNGEEIVASEGEHFCGDSSFKMLEAPVQGGTWWDVIERERELEDEAAIAS